MIYAQNAFGLLLTLNVNILGTNRLPNFDYSYY